MSRELMRLMKLERKELVELFLRLHPPEVREMDGEFKATILDQGKWIHNFATIVAFNWPGAWLSKSFTPLSDTEGYGFNSYRVGRTIRKIFRMKTWLGPSKYDDKQSYHLDYVSVEKQERIPRWSNLESELRKLSDDMYLGVGTANFGISRFSRPQPFLLQGPVARFDRSVWSADESANPEDSRSALEKLEPPVVGDESVPEEGRPEAESLEVG